MTGWSVLNYKGVKRIQQFIFAFLWLAVSGAVVLAQTPTETPVAPVLTESEVSARFSTSNNRPLTGEAFTLELNVSLPSGTELAELPTFPSQGAWDDFDVVQVGEVQTETLSDGTVVYRQVLTVKLWQPRDYNTPETFIGYRLTGFNDVQRIPVRVASITVPTVLDFEDLTLRPFKPLINLPYLSPWLILGGLVVVGAVIGFGYWRRQRRPIPVTLPEPVLTPAEIARQKLNRLKSSEELTPEAQYTRVAVCLREYVQAKFEIGELTTAEMIAALPTRLPEKALNDLGRILTETDLIKFAAAQPQIEIARRLIEAARRWIDTVEQITTEGPMSDAE